MKTTRNGLLEMEADNLVRLPGLFRRWEFEQVIDDDADEFRIEAAGTATDGTALFAVYRRDRSLDGGAAP